MELTERLRVIIAEIRHEHAPDPRLAVYEVGVAEGAEGVVVAGVVSEPAALEALRHRIATLADDVPVRDEVERLPASSVGERCHAVVSVAIAPILAGPMVSEPQISQAVLGHHLLILRERGRWLQVRSDDGYLGWVHRGYLRRMDEVEARAWRVGADGDVYLSLGAEVRSDGDEVLARLPWGARILVRDGQGVLPGGATGRLAGETIPAADRRARFPARGDAIVATASAWIGSPYLWAGITPSGVDCSGLVQAVMRMHGVELPRDSDQQARVGETVDAGPEYHALQPGDLLFFAEEVGRVSHVAISLGGPRILHSALGNGGVRRNDLLGESAFEAELRRLFVAARRVIPSES